MHGYTKEGRRGRGRRGGLKGESWVRDKGKTKRGKGGLKRKGRWGCVNGGDLKRKEGWGRGTGEGWEDGV